MTIVLLRTILVFASLMVSMRLLGKRQMGEMELSELVVSILAADMAATPLQDIGVPLLNGLIPIFVLFCCELILSDLAVRSIRIRSLLYGKPCILVRDGRIQQEEMRRSRITVDELTEELRSKDIMDVSKVKFAILETNGTLSAILLPEERPVTAGQMGMKPKDEGYATIIIEEGRLLSENLALTGHDMNWLDKQLRRNGAGSIREVYTLIVFGSGRVYFQKMEKEHA